MVSFLDGSKNQGICLGPLCKGALLRGSRDLRRAEEDIDELEEPDFAAFSVCEILRREGRTENCPISPVSGVVLSIPCTASGGCGLR
jgi:hypothetical protein